MKPAVLLSIQPQWCEKIASGEKTVEVRKNRPKMETPFKCYMYCTKNGRPLVYAEPTPYNTEPLLHRTYGWNRKRADEIFGIWNGKVIGEFVCDKVDKYRFSNYAAEYDVTHVHMAQMYLNLPELIAYGTGDPLYGWHISDLKIYDNPKELGEFWAYNAELHNRFAKEEDFYCYNGTNEYGELLDFYTDILNCYRCWEAWSGWCHRIKRPPQSWCYVEELV